MLGNVQIKQGSEKIMYINLIEQTMPTNCGY